MTEPLPLQTIYAEISTIVSHFSLLECDECAIAVWQWANQNGVPSKSIKLKTKRRSDLYIISDRITSNETITENGTHYGIEVMGKVFDNLSPQGMSREQWLKDFHCRSGQFILEELDSL